MHCLKPKTKQLFTADAAGYGIADGKTQSLNLNRKNLKSLVDKYDCNLFVGYCDRQPACIKP